MEYDDELIQKQLKNLKRKIVTWVWESSPTRIIQLALFIGIRVPRKTLEIFISEQSGSSDSV